MPDPPTEQGSQPKAAETGPPDAELIRAAQAGDEQAFAALVRRHQGRAQNIARNMIGDPEEAADLVQEAFLRVFRSLDRFDFDHAFPTWLHRIVSNLGIDHLRRRRPVAPGTGTGGDDDEGGAPEPIDLRSDTPDEALSREETQREVRACIDSLAPHFRSVLALRELEGLPCTEIADIVGATHVTVRWRLHRGRKLFQDEWERRRRAADARLGTAASDETK